MKKTLFISLCIFISGLMLSSCGPNDIAIQGKVNNALLSYPQVSSTVRSAVVTLTGVVETDEAKTQAEADVKALKDVKAVVNEIEVVAPAPVVSPDETLRAAIILALDNAKVKGVEVAVKDEEVTLSGAVAKADQKKVMQLLKGFKTKKVTSQMK